MELDQNSGCDSPDPGYDVVSLYAIPDQEDAMPFSNKENVGVAQSEGESFATPQVSLNPVLNLEEKSEENVQVEGLQIRDTRKRFSMWKIDMTQPVLNVDEKTKENWPIEGLQNKNVKELEETKKRFTIWKMDVRRKAEFVSNISDAKLLESNNRLDVLNPCDSFGTSVPVHTASAGTRKVAVVGSKPKEMEILSKQIIGPLTECDFVEKLLNTENMFEVQSVEMKKQPSCEKHTDGSVVEEGTNFQRDMSQEWPSRGRGLYSGEGSAERESEGSCRQWTQNVAEQHPDYKCRSVGPEEAEEMEPPLQLKYVDWIGKEEIGRFFVSGLTTVDAAGNGEIGSKSQLNFLTFDEIMLLDGLETAVISTTDSIETIVTKGFVARFPASCKLRLLINDENRHFPEYAIVCSSCPKLIRAHQAGTARSCSQCRIVQVSTYLETKIKCQFMLLRSARMLRFVVLSSSLSISEWESRLHFGWFHNFLAIHEAKPNCNVSSDQQHAHFWRDLTEFLASVAIFDLNLLSGIDLSTISPAVRLIYTKPVVSCANDPSKYGVPQLQNITKSLIWKSPKNVQSLYKTERLGQNCCSILNDAFCNTCSADIQTSKKHVKVVYPSLRWVNECVVNSESPERLELLSTIKDKHSVGDLPWNVLHDLRENKDFVQNYNVLMQSENWEEAGKMRKYGWLLTGSQSLGTESWGTDYPVFHKVMYKHFQLSIGLFPYLRWNKNLKEAEVCAIDLCDVPLPFDPVALDRYHHDDMPRLVLGSGQNVLRHCVGVFTRAKPSYGFIRQSPLLKGLLEPFPKAQPGQSHRDVFLHESSLQQKKLPPEGSVIEFFFLDQPPTGSDDFIRVCSIFTSIEETRHHFLSAKPSVAVDEDLVHKEMVQAKALELGIEWLDNVEQMEDAIEDHYNTLFSSCHRNFTYFPTQQQIDAISIEPAKIINDSEWVQSYYKNRRNRGGLPQDVGGCRPSVLLANFQAMKYRFVKELREVEECNQKMEKEN